MTSTRVATSNALHTYDLILVMPVYNEEECIANVLHSWRDMLLTCDINFLIIVLNDGSRDNTASQLAIFSTDQHIKIINKKNSGHGPTILAGYRSAVEQAEWVAQVDSDDEMPPDEFPLLWKQRHDYDAIFGIRTSRIQNRPRKLLSKGAALLTRLIFKSRVDDANIPYRLMRSSFLRDIVAIIPDDTFAPNILISGALSLSAARICNHPVPHLHRRTGLVSLVNWRLFRAAVKSLAQTIIFRFRIRPWQDRAA